MHTQARFDGRAWVAVRTPPETARTVHAVALAPDGSLYLASGAEGQTSSGVVDRRHPDGRWEGVFRTGGPPMKAVAHLPDDKSIAVEQRRFGADFPAAPSGSP